MLSPIIDYAVLDRRTLEVVAQPQQSVGADLAGIKKLRAIATSYSGSQDYYLVLNWTEFNGDSEGRKVGMDVVRNEFGALLEQIGSEKLTDGNAN